MDPLLDARSGRIVREQAPVHQSLELRIGIILVTIFAKVLLVIQVEVQNDRRRIGKAEEQTIPLQPLFVASVFAECSCQPIVFSVGVLGNDGLIGMSNASRELDDFMLGVLRLGQAGSQLLYLFFESLNSPIVERMVFEQIPMLRQRLPLRANPPTHRPRRRGRRAASQGAS